MTKVLIFFHKKPFNQNKFRLRYKKVDCRSEAIASSGFHLYLLKT